MTAVDDRSETLQWYVEPPKRRPRWIRRAVPIVAGLGLLAGAAGAGTMASFSGTTDNAGGTFETGSLVLSNTVPATTACLSTDGGMPLNSADCDTVFDLSVQQPGDTATGDGDVENVGSIDGSLKVHADGACVDGDAADTAYHGTANLCDELRLSVQQYADEPSRTADDTTGGTCLYGGGMGGQTCDFGDGAKTLSAFATAYPDFTTTLPAGAMPASGTGSVRYLRISVHLDASADNDFQGRAASFGLTWRLES